ncbi:hypothetical protein AA0116_g4534 [Alternaria tenuissima]|nr:hypothetical protein AA0116_g4534 [Alternaria tenuissima]
MSATTIRSPLDQLYFDRFHAVTNLYSAEKYEEAYAGCRRYLLDVHTPKWHQAGFHIMLGNSDDCYVAHAKRAVELYQFFVGRTDEDLSEAHIELQKRSLSDAEYVYKRALEDQKKAQDEKAEDDELELVGRGEEDDDALMADREAEEDDYHALEDAQPILYSDEEDIDTSDEDSVDSDTGVPEGETQEEAPVGANISDNHKDDQGRGHEVDREEQERVELEESAKNLGVGKTPGYYPTPSASRNPTGDRSGLLPLTPGPSRRTTEDEKKPSEEQG